ncbi:ComE operon protein 2 [Weizmannia acidilactici]|uniref:ComE operon protein 2 n=1 Tax=Weizmannia acidilactici TaxID=2607726 RepID=A0A5J4JG70_9BACI|nr:ComE operon protein 2 [Weizmannia acidilactici]GER66961.1 ComE operon protein 2 [Weizmannia acidilactici]GER69615.1 ComE operon protein 2 [Weizmannia acidilactici]GER72708.1 ComE operon protein 2 [Weizmannia acidilactici]
MDRISWNQYFLAQSHLLSYRSTCSRLAVGATIVRDKRIIAGGYNGSIAGDEHCIDKGCYVIDGHCVRTIHAEMNAILQCAKFGVATKDAEIYVTHYPCLQCTKAIIQAGIKSVYYAQDYRVHPYAAELFEKAGVHVEHVAFLPESLDIHAKEKAELVERLFMIAKDHGADAEELKNLREEAEALFAGGFLAETRHVPKP